MFSSTLTHAAYLVRASVRHVEDEGVEPGVDELADGVGDLFLGTDRELLVELRAGVSRTLKWSAKRATADGVLGHGPTMGTLTMDVVAL